MDTIFAQATAPGKAGVAIIRISGPEAFHGCARLTGPLPPPRRAALRSIRDLSGAVLDSGLVLNFPGGASFTGEPVVELHLHGSVAVVRATLSALAGIPGFRAAEAGEFTRRALENERLDLTQVEGLADLIDAETDLQREQARRVLTGELSSRVQSWRRDLVEAAALIEATLDFSDEEVPVDVRPDVLAILERVERDLGVHSAGADAAERIRDGFEIAIMGPPNAGKSTLLNNIAKRQVALTSEIAGTTRDVIEVRIDLNGFPVTLLDTAGLRETLDPLEAAGIGMARARAREADLRIWLSLAAGDAPEEADIVLPARDDAGSLGGISGRTGAGVSDLLGRVHTVLAGRVPPDRLAVRERHRRGMLAAGSHLGESMKLIRLGQDGELVAEEIRRASEALAEMIGAVGVEDLLDEIFGRFCIGK